MKSSERCNLITVKIHGYTLIPGKKSMLCFMMPLILPLTGAGAFGLPHETMALCALMKTAKPLLTQKIISEILLTSKACLCLMTRATFGLQPAMVFIVLTP